jgi:hypothetical protein
VSALSWAWFAVALALLGLIVVACVVLANVFRVLTSVKALIDGVTRETVPIINAGGETVALVNAELGRVDGVLANAEQISDSARQLAAVIQGTVTSPLVRVAAFAWGLRRAAGITAEEDGQGGGRRRRRRR